MAALDELHDALAKNDDSYWAEQVDIQRMVANAWMAFAGRATRARGRRLLRAAADREDATEKSAVTPGPLMPARESLGDLLLELKRPAEALPMYEKTLAKEPNRLKSVYGAAHAAELSGDRPRLTTTSPSLPRSAREPTRPNRRELGRRCCSCRRSESAGNYRNNRPSSCYTQSRRRAASPVPLEFGFPARRPRLSC